MKQIKITLSEKNFADLVNGDIVEHYDGTTKVQICLSDIGFHSMEKAVKMAVEKSIHFGKIRYNPEDDIKDLF